jgi:hypothetical protein
MIVYWVNINNSRALKCCKFNRKNMLFKAGELDYMFIILNTEAQLELSLNE